MSALNKLVALPCFAIQVVLTIALLALIVALACALSTIQSMWRFWVWSWRQWSPLRWKELCDRAADALSNLERRARAADAYKLLTERMLNEKPEDWT